MTTEVDPCRRQILTTKVDPRAVRVNVGDLGVLPQEKNKSEFLHFDA